jgi:hypothetical protein
VTHRIVGDLTYRLPFGFNISGIAQYRSGVPYSRTIAFAGAMNLNGLTQTTGNIPVFVDGNGQIIDLTQANGLTRPQLADFLGARGAHIIGRNTERQPDVWNADLRLSKTFGLPRGLQLEVLGEVFNVFNTKDRFVGAANQTMFNAVYTAATDRYTITRVTNAAAQPTFGLVNGYEASVDPRQYQVAAKIRF